MRFTIPDRLNTFRAESQRTEYFVTVPRGITPEEVLHPDTFIHCRKRLRVYDTFECVAEDGSYELAFRVVSVNKVTGDIKLRLLSLWRPPEGQQAEPVRTTSKARFEARWNAGSRKHEIYERATGVSVAEGFGSLEEAQAEAVRLETARQAA